VLPKMRRSPPRSILEQMRVSGARRASSGGSRGKFQIRNPDPSRLPPFSPLDLIARFNLGFELGLQCLPQAGLLLAGQFG